MTSESAGTRWSRWRVGGAEQTLLEQTFAETLGFPDASVRSSLARVLEVSERRIQVWFQNHRQRGRYAEDSRLVASLGLNTIILLCIYTRIHPTIPYDAMARYVANVLDTVEDPDNFTRTSLSLYIVKEARTLVSDAIDEHDAIHIAVTGLLVRIARVFGLPVLEQ